MPEQHQHEPIDPSDLRYVLPVLDMEELDELCMNPRVVGAPLDAVGVDFIGREAWPDDRQRSTEHLHHRYWSRITDSDIEGAFWDWVSL